MTESTDTESTDKAKRARNETVKTKIDLEAASFTMSWADGQVETYALADFPEGIRVQAAIGQIINKGKASYQKDGVKDAAIAQGSFASAMTLLVAGTWNENRTGSGDGAKLSDLNEAVFRYLAKQGKDTTRDKVREFMAGQSAGERAQWRRHEAVSPFYAEVQAERVTAKGGKEITVDLGALDAI